MPPSVFWLPVPQADDTDVKALTMLTQLTSLRAAISKSDFATLGTPATSESSGAMFCCKLQAGRQAADH